MSAEAESKEYPSVYYCFAAVRLLDWIDSARPAATVFSIGVGVYGEPLPVPMRVCPL